MAEVSVASVWVEWVGAEEVAAKAAVEEAAAEVAADAVSEAVAAVVVVLQTVFIQYSSAGSV